MAGKRRHGTRRASRRALARQPPFLFAAPPSSTTSNQASGRGHGSTSEGVRVHTSVSSGAVMSVLIAMPTVGRASAIKKKKFALLGGSEAVPRSDDAQNGNWVVFAHRWSNGDSNSNTRGTRSDALQDGRQHGLRWVRR